MTARPTERLLNLGTLIFLSAASYYYLGGMRIGLVLLYLVALAYSTRMKALTMTDSILIGYIIIATILRWYALDDLRATLLYDRLYWGFVPFFFYFKVRPKINLVFIANVLSALTIIEFVAIRIVPDLTNILGNYDNTFDGMIEGYGLVGGVHSFGGNRTVTGVLLLSLFVLLEKFKKERSLRWLPAIGSVICFSGTTILLFIVYYVVKTGKVWIGVVWLALGLSIVFYAQEILPKASSSYIKEVFDYKSAQIESCIETVFEPDPKAFLIGSNIRMEEGEKIENFGMLYGDFLWLEFLVRFGLAGVGIMVMATAANVKSETALPILILLIGTAHYHVIFALPGQVIFGYMLAMGANRTAAAVGAKAREPGRQWGMA